MRKSDLKTGMRIRTRNGHIMLVLKDVETRDYGCQDLVFVDTGGFNLGSDYTEDMTDIDDSGYDIVEVYNTTDEHAFSGGVLNLDIRTSIWKRVEYTENQKTVIEALKVLGYNYIAKDSDMKVYAYSERPVKAFHSWIEGEEAPCTLVDSLVTLVVSLDVAELVSWDDVEPFRI